jgi:GNAT superfamily N-acetyltransferase
MIEVRGADPAELDRLARLWHGAWLDAHESLAPPELTRVRTLESFRARLDAALPELRVVGPIGEPLGFCLLKGDELHQLFLAPEARGTGVAAALMEDAERRLAASGVARAWLACAIGNHRAARFYEKQGWQRVGVVLEQLETPGGVFPLEVWRYEKAIPGVERSADR